VMKNRYQFWPGLDHDPALDLALRRLCLLSDIPGLSGCLISIYVFGLTPEPGHP
jgi:hypothetical protein